MTAPKSAIIAQLQKDILPLQGFKKNRNSTILDLNLGPVKNAFPNAQFPIGAVHEFCYTGAEDAAATSGFVSGVLASLMRTGGVSIWISADRMIFPPALQSFGIAPDKIIFIDLQKESDIEWAMEEALKCNGLAAVVGEMPELSFTASRRLQLAVEQSQVTGFILRRNPRSLSTTACVTRWKITSIPTILADDMPGVGFPCWKVELLKVRNGKPGTWQIEFAAGKFRHLPPAIILDVQEPQKKTG
ncbi:MAG: Error-prone repair protein ImuA [Rhizobacter sp.]|nr:Error-prone repair protein ImuA [Ferruginibacter sp.]